VRAATILSDIDGPMAPGEPSKTRLSALDGLATIRQNDVKCLIFFLYACFLYSETIARHD